MLGQKVKIFNMQSTPAGYHAIKWNGKNDNNQSVSGGVYIYKLQSRQKMQMRKMILLK
jgi:flagellar hook assembly protein FlgD